MKILIDGFASEPRNAILLHAWLCGMVIISYLSHAAIKSVSEKKTRYVFLAQSRLYAILFLFYQEIESSLLKKVKI